MARRLAFIRKVPDRKNREAEQDTTSQATRPEKLLQ